MLITILVDGQTAVERIGKFLNEDGVEQYVEKDQAPHACSLQVSNAPPGQPHTLHT
eukprot:COSAG05_NODE_1829_length_4002_cov_3.573917_7_plen_56_part_00